MASKRRRKQVVGAWEGEQYRGGRRKGCKNLTRTADGIVNQYGVTFSEEQKKALERAVDRSNYRRAKQIAEWDALNENARGLRTMGKESDFIISRQSKSLQRFKSMEDYEKFMDKQARIQSGEHLEEMTRLYKRNYMSAIDNVFGAAGAGVKMKIRMMKPADFRRLVEEKGEDLEIGYIYGPEARIGKLNVIRETLGMKMVEDDIFDETDE